MSSLCDSCVLESSRATGDPYSDTDSNNYAYHGSNLRQLARQVGGSIKCDSGSIVAGAACLVIGASGPALDSGVRFAVVFSVAASAFALGLVLNFGSLVMSP